MKSRLESRKPLLPHLVVVDGHCAMQSFAHESGGYARYVRTNHISILKMKSVVRGLPLYIDVICFQDNTDREPEYGVDIYTSPEKEPNATFDTPYKSLEEALCSMLSIVPTMHKGE